MNPWFAIARDAARLSIEAQGVIALRLAHFARPGFIDWAEFQRMIAEKAEAMGQVQAAMVATFLSGQQAPALARKTISIYGRHVRDNQRRLSRD
jgi:hypothetical protein